MPTPTCTTGASMDRPLRIAIIASGRFPIAQPFAGGLEAHVWHLTRALAAAGDHVTLFAGAGSDVGTDAEVFSTELFEPSAAARADGSMPPMNVLADHHAYLSLMLELARRPDRFDVIHNHSLHHLPIAMAPAVRIPMVTTLHTPPTPWLESAMTIAPLTRCIAVSEHTARSWAHVLGNVPVVPNGVRLDRWPVGPGGGDLVWFGRLVPEKGAHVAIEAARRAGRRLRIAGPVSDPNYFAAMIAPELDDDVRYVGHLEQSDLARLVGSSAATMVTPLWDEPYGLVVAESMCCGTPVVSFERGGIPEIVGNHGVLVPRDDVTALAAGAVKAQRVDRGSVRAHARAHCSLETMVERYRNLYRGLIGSEEVSA